VLSDSIRVDAGFIAGDEVSSHYDPMIAKLIVSGPDRTSTVQKLYAALENYEVAGPITNIEFLKRVCQHPSFIDGDVETGFIPKHRSELFVDIPAPAEVFAQAALGTVLQDVSRLASLGTVIGGTSGFTPGFQKRTLRFTAGGEIGGKDASEVVVHVAQISSDTFNVTVDGVSYSGVVSHWEDETLLLTSYFPHIRLDTRLIFEDGEITIFQQGTQYRLQHTVPKWMEKAMGVKHIANSVLAPMPCKVLRILVEEGDSVQKDQALVVIESMKMETTIRSPQTGKVARIVHRQGVFVYFHDDKVHMLIIKYRISVKLALRSLSSKNSQCDPDHPRSN
jgi:3-methylcrotonyl-CoA carboxylase alpha subunit